MYVPVPNYFQIMYIKSGGVWFYSGFNMTFEKFSVYFIWISKQFLLHIVTELEKLAALVNILHAEQSPNAVNFVKFTTRNLTQLTEQVALFETIRPIQAVEPSWMGFNPVSI